MMCMVACLHRTRSLNLVNGWVVVWVWVWVWVLENVSENNTVRRVRMTMQEKRCAHKL